MVIRYGGCFPQTSDWLDGRGSQSSGVRRRGRGQTCCLTEKNSDAIDAASGLHASANIPKRALGPNSTPASARSAGLVDRVAALTAEDREAIRVAATRGKVSAVKEFRERLGWSIPDAATAIDLVWNPLDAANPAHPD